MKLIQANTRTLAIAANLLYKICGSSIRIQLVEYELFHILVSLNDGSESQFGIVVAEPNLLSTSEYQSYIDVLRQKTYQRDDSDNLPILLMIVDSIQECAQIGIQLGWSSSFTPIVYSNVTLKNFDEQWYSKLYMLIKAMNSTITVLSREYLSVLKKISIHGIAENGHKFEGYLLYARSIFPAIPSLVPKIKKNLNEDISGYQYTLQSGDDELDKFIFEITEKMFTNIAIVSHIDDKLLFTNKDVQALQMYGKIQNYEKRNIQYNLLPTIDKHGDYCMFSKWITPIRINKMTLVIRGQYNKDWASTLNQYIHDTNIKLDEWVEYSKNMNTKLETMINLYDIIE